MRAGERNVKKVEGRFYLDSSPISVEIVEGHISNVTPIDQLPEGAERTYIAPGFIDNQVNGFAGVSFSLGGGELTVEGARKVTEALWTKGVTTCLPTLTTNSHETLLKNFSILAAAKNDENLLGSIPGFHLEGPYISPADGYRGAHALKHVRNPDWNEFMELFRASGENILTVTLAPELENALDFISKCRGKNIVVALGHHDAPAEIISQAADRGARIATHLGNGCANTIDRHRNPLWPQLSDDRLLISIICDNFHLLPEEIRVFYKVKGPGKTIITSDVTSFGSLPPGNYETHSGEAIELSPEGRLSYPDQHVLYGSASPLSKGIGHIMHVTGCSLADAVQMASINPAELYNLNDRGSIEPGKRADLVLFTADHSEIKINKTFVRGELVYQR